MTFQKYFSVRAEPRSFQLNTGFISNVFSISLKLALALFLTLLFLNISTLNVAGVPKPPGGSGCDDGNPCTSGFPVTICNALCSPVAGPCCNTHCEYTNINEGGSCDDGLFCTTGEICTSGVCGGGSGIDVDDAVSCTDDSCDEGSDQVLNTPNNALCDNGMFCDGAEICVAGLGCHAGAAVNPDDGVACTDDSCDEEADVVVNTVNDANCDDGEFCSGVETCDATLDCQADQNPPDGEMCIADAGPDGICIDDECVNDGTLTIVKEAFPTDGTDFLFSCTDSSLAACADIGDVDGMFALDDEPVDTDGVMDMETFPDMIAGEYVIQEVLPDGWDIVDVICENDADGGTIGDPVLAQAVVDLDPGEDITCTFINEDIPATIERLNGSTYMVLLKNTHNSIFITGVTPYKRAAVYWGFKQGNGVIGGGKCAGTELGIKPFALLAKLKANGNGVVNKTFYVPSVGASQAFLQVVDMGNCLPGPRVKVVLYTN